MLITSKAVAIVAAATLAPAAVLLAAPAASASAYVPRVAAPATYRAVTYLTNRPDGGNGGTWATDTVTRTLTITVAGTPGSYHDTATVTDTGTFAPIGGALTPNQSTPGKRIAARPQVFYAAIFGTAHYSFTARALPSSAPNMGVPASENGAPVTPGQSTSSWYLQAFPSSAVASPVGITTWGWDYAALVISRGALRFQQWADTSSNGDGDLPGDGNITG
jgi:hypothetical protein